MEEKEVVEFGVEMVEMVSGKDGSVAGQRRAMAAGAFSVGTKEEERKRNEEKEEKRGVVIYIKGKYYIIMPPHKTPK